MNGPEQVKELNDLLVAVGFCLRILKPDNQCVQSYDRSTEYTMFSDERQYKYGKMVNNMSTPRGSLKDTRREISDERFRFTTIGREDDNVEQFNYQ